jgi:type I restriction enzyme S subunit
MFDSGFHFIPASSFCSKVIDGTHDSPKAVASGKPLITSKHIKGRNIDFDSAYMISFEDFTSVNKGSQVCQWDVIISMIGEYCGYCYVERNEQIDYAIKNVGVFRAGSQLNAEWLYYYLNSPIGKSHLDSVRSGSSQPYLSLGALRSLPILVPSSDGHKRQIVQILSALDSKIELNHRINVELEGMAELLYDYWFVQYDFPLSAAQAAALGKPRLAGKPYRTSGGPMLYHDHLKREVPKGWMVGSLLDIATFTNGIACQKFPPTSEEHLRVIKPCSVAL